MGTSKVALPDRPTGVDEVGISASSPRPRPPRRPPRGCIASCPLRSTLLPRSKFVLEDTQQLSSLAPCREFMAVLLHSAEPEHKNHQVDSYTHAVAIGGGCAAVCLRVRRLSVGFCRSP